MRRAALAAVGGMLLLCAAGAQAGTTRATLTPLQATNKLLALPWERYGRQVQNDLVNSLEELEGKDVAEVSKTVGITYKGQGVKAKVKFGVKAVKVDATADFHSPPGLAAASTSEIAFRAPLDGGWRFGFAAILKPYAWAKVAGVKIWDMDALVPLGLSISDFRLAARADLDSSDPERPRLVRATVTPQLKLGGGGALPGVVPIEFKTVVRQGRVTMTGELLGVPLSDFGFADARLGGVLTLVIEPVAGGDLGLDQFVRVTATLRGRVTAEIRYVHEETFDFNILSVAANVPAPQELSDFLRLSTEPTPRTWGEDNPLGRVPPPPAARDYATPAATLETGIMRHMPQGAVLSIDCKALDARGTQGCQGPTWAGEEDSAIWTGHYLAAEAFRAAVRDPGAIVRVRGAVAGIERLFWVTGDTAVADDKRTNVKRRGFFARTALPVLVRGERGIDYGEPLDRHRCYYERPERGWTLGRGKTYARWFDVPQEQRSSAQPLGRMWRGFGCGDDHPLSKDQYTGVLYGLALAYRLVPDDDVHTRTGALIEQALDYLIAEQWNVRLPPRDRIETTFLGDFPKQLAFLRIGVLVNAQKYGARYAELAPAAANAWVPIWFSAADPVLQYYKFNLSHATLASALMLETDPVYRAGYLKAHALMWRAVRHHRNAYFSLLRILMQEPAQRAAVAASPSAANAALTSAQEIRSVLADWLDRYELVKASTGMPTAAVAKPQEQVALWPSNIGDFVALDGTARKLARYPLPLTARNGRDKDFLWQRDPFDTSYRGGTSGCAGAPPTEAEVRRCGGRPNRIQPGVDYLLAYWLARYLSVVPTQPLG